MPIADSAISKLGLASEQLMEAVEQRATARNGRAIRTALTTLRYADARAESGGESVARAIMIETGFAPDWLQYELTDPFYGHPLLRFTMNEVRSAGMLAKKLQTAGIRQTALPTWLNDVEL